MSRLTDWFKRHATRAVQRDCRRLEAEAADLRVQLREATTTIDVQRAEIDQLAAVVARNTLRIKAETAAAAARVAAAEPENDGSD